MPSPRVGPKAWHPIEGLSIRETMSSPPAYIYPPGRPLPTKILFAKNYLSHILTTLNAANFSLDTFSKIDKAFHHVPL